MMDAPLRKIEGAFSETAIDGEIVVMSLQSGEFFSLVDSAAAIWSLIDGTRDRIALIAAAARQHAAQPDLIAPDVDAFLGQLSAAGLIEAA